MRHLVSPGRRSGPPPQQSAGVRRDRLTSSSISRYSRPAALPARSPQVCIFTCQSGYTCAKQNGCFQCVRAATPTAQCSASLPCPANQLCTSGGQCVADPCKPANPCPADKPSCRASASFTAVCEAPACPTGQQWLRGSSGAWACQVPNKKSEAPVKRADRPARRLRA